ncbi:M28 family peptidase [Autumnicola psychrophila]|uniref:Vacuolar membrane protease n=1 Tax=Autumnicola psychrophila TaxID=3075592 RepID=A0ABU3DNP4_9FLAO|nr:M28 family peptidase [Zunongwangia sp. F225]MDT0685339.1 M28 family peptidase [Zunongwangia sp. F225]
MLNKFSAVFGFLLILFAIWLNYYSSQPEYDPSQAIPETEFSTTRAFSHVEQIAQQPHFVGSAAHSRVRNYIIDELQEMDLQVQIQEGYHLNNSGEMARPQNILSRIEGSGDGEALMLMTHYDSNPHSSFGASDAGSGVATILEGVRAFLADSVNKNNDIILLFTDAEELGLNGAGLFIEEHPWANDAKLALNFESRGSGGNSFMFLETNTSNSALIRAFKEANPQFPATNSLAYSVYKMLPNDTDLTVLREQGNINGFNFAFIDDHFDYHTATDVPENLDKETLAQQGTYLMPLLYYFKDADLSLDSSEDLLFFDLPFGKIVSYPFSWIFPLLIGAGILFLAVLIYGFSIKRLRLRPALRGFVPFLQSLIISGVLVYLLWQFCLMIYPEYSEMEQGFTYNGYYYIYAAIFLSLTVNFFSYRKVPKSKDIASRFVAPLFFWLLLCCLLAFALKGAAYFIIPAYFGILQLFVMIRQKRPNLLLMAILSLPAIFILMPFLDAFPVALGLNILFVSAILTVLLFSLLLPVFGYFRRNKALAVLSFVVFNVLFLIAHFQSDFTAERPKPNSLVYLLDADSDKAKWFSYDKMPDEWTANYFGDEPVIQPLKMSNFDSKYGSSFTYSANATEVEIPEPAILLQLIDSTEKVNEFSLKIAPNRNVNRIELFAETNLDFEEFEVNGQTADEILLGENNFHVFKKRWKEQLLLYHAVGKDTLRINFSLKKDKKPEFLLFESSYDLMENSALNVPERQDWMIPRPFVVNDAVIVKKKITWKGNAETSSEEVTKN